MYLYNKTYTDFHSFKTSLAGASHALNDWKLFFLSGKPEEVINVNVDTACSGEASKTGRPWPRTDHKRVLAGPSYNK